MTLIHRYSVKTFMNQSRLLDEPKLRKYVRDERKHSTDADLDDFIAVLKYKRGKIGGLLTPLRNKARVYSGAAGVTKAVMFLGGKSDNLNATLNPVENAIVKVTAVQQAKLFVYAAYDLSIHEMPSPTSASGYRLELRLYSLDGAQLLAASDEPVTSGPRVKVKPTVGAST